MGADVTNHPVRVRTSTGWQDLALVGPQGPAGPQGPPGATGSGAGDVSGPASAVADRIAVYNGTTGKVIKDGGKTIAELEPVIAEGTTAQYWRGDKSWQTLPAGYTDEQVDDRVAALLVAGTNITLNYNDAANSLTINGSGAGTASGITFTPAGNIAATNVQAAIVELDNEKEPVIAAGTTAQYWRGDKSWQTLPTGGGTAASVTFTPAGNIAATNVQAALVELDNEKELVSNKGIANGYAPLDATTKIASAYLPAYVDEVVEYANLAAFPGTGTAGIIYIALDTNKTYRWGGSSYTEISPSPGSTDSVPEGSVNLYHTTARASAAAPVQSVATKTGAVTLVKGDVGLANVDNTSDANKPVSTAQQTAINGRVSDLGDTMTGDLTISKADPSLILNRTSTTASLIVGQRSGFPRWTVCPGDGSAESTNNLGSNFMIVRHTDLGGQIDAAFTINRATGITNLKAGSTVGGVQIAPLVSPVFTGTPAADTAALGTSTTQLATTAFVAAAVSGATGGTITEAPNDGQTYGRKNLGWNLLDTSIDWTDVTGKPSTFPPTLPIAQSDVTNLVSDLALKAPLASPALTGTPTAPTAPAANNTTQIATTAFVQSWAVILNASFSTSLDNKQPIDATLTGLAALDTTTGMVEQTGATAFAKRALGVAAGTSIPTRADADTRYAALSHAHPQADITNLVSDLALKAPLASPTFTGDPKAPTPSAGDNDTSIATTAFVAGAVTTATVPPSTVAPLMDGVAAVGTTTKYAREDHKHPTDTSREPTLAVGTTAQYYRGDKSWQTLDKTAVGLANVDNTSDANKPVSTAQATANALRVLKTGDVMTGNLALPVTANSGNNALNWGTVGTGINGNANEITFSTGGTLRATFDLGVFMVDVPVRLPGNPSNVLDAAPKQYVDLRADYAYVDAQDATKAPLVHEHTTNDITNLAESIDDRVNTLLQAGANISLSYNDVANTLTIASSGGGGGAAVIASDTVPVGASDNSIWFESDTGLCYIRYNDGSSTQWAIMSPMPDVATFVRNDAPQSLSTAQQVQTRQNVYAAPFDAMAYSGMQYNGGMEINQPGFTSITAGGKTIDGWTYSLGGISGSSIRCAVETGPTQLGYPSLLSVQTLTTGTVGSSDRVGLYHTIEGYRIARLGWGAATQAQPITIAFWTCHNRVGTYTGAVYNGTTNRSCAFSYAQIVSSAWEYKTVTIPGDQTGTWARDNTAGMTVYFAVAGGASTLAPATGTWYGAIYYGATGQTNGVAATSDIFRITGVSVLPGAEAPVAARAPLIMRPYDQELMTSQRYFQTLGPGLTGGAVGSTVAAFGASFRPTMRFYPTLTGAPIGTIWQMVTNTTFTNVAGGWSISAANPLFNGAEFQLGGFTGLTNGAVVTMRSMSVPFVFDARLG